MFQSILLPDKKDYTYTESQPDFFVELNLDQIVNEILRQTKHHELTGYFYSPLQDHNSIIYRQNILREIEQHGIAAELFQFAENIDAIHEKLAKAQNISDMKDYAAMGQILDCADRYTAAVRELLSMFIQNEKNKGPFTSEGFCSFICYISELVSDKIFTDFESDIKSIREQLSSITFCFDIKGKTIRIAKYNGEKDLSAEIRNTFVRFKSDKMNKYSKNIVPQVLSYHVEVAVLKMLSGLFRHEFSALKKFCIKHHIDFIDPKIIRFAREIRFYLSWLNYIDIMKKHGLHFCYPDVYEAEKAGSREIFVKGLFDSALADKNPDAIVTNDVSLSPPEHIIVITGPNQGGKTTFARALGQIEYLATLGVCVPGRDASLIIPDRIFTHFNKEETLVELNGKLADDLMRLKMLLDQATGKSMIIINEIFASTTVDDAVVLGKKMMDILSQKSAFSLVITFLDELALHGPETVSMASQVDKENPSKRTYKLFRKKPDGLVYAKSLAEKHGLTYQQLLETLE